MHKLQNFFKQAKLIFQNNETKPIKLLKVFMENTNFDPNPLTKNTAANHVKGLYVRNCIISFTTV